MLSAAIYDVFCDDFAVGNPCAVVFLEQWLNEQELLSIAQKLAQPVTSFVVSYQDDHNAQQHHVRWFTAVGEINLCGHGSLAAGAALLKCCKQTEVALQSDYGTVYIAEYGGFYHIRLPSWQARPYSMTSTIHALGLVPVDVFTTRDLVVVLASEQAVMSFQPDMALIQQINDVHALIITAQSGPAEYVLRYFTPKSGIDEDSATGSAHCSLAPYWFDRLDTEQLQARQLSSRGGFFKLSKHATEAVSIAAQVKVQTQTAVI